MLLKEDTTSAKEADVDSDPAPLLVATGIDDVADIEEIELELAELDDEEVVPVDCG